MEKVSLALQVYTVREDAEKDFLAAMEQIKSIGYDYVELSGLYGHQPKKIASMLKETKVQAISAHVPFKELLVNHREIIENYCVIGCQYIAIPYLTEEFRPGTPGFGKVLESIPKIGTACNEMGITLLYHNHDFEFAKMNDGRYALDYIYESIPSSLLQTELDTCWIDVVGESPVAYIQKYAKRCPVVHLKDYYKQELARNTHDSKDIPGYFEFRPLGYGMQVMPELISAAITAGARYLVVEQDVSVGRSAMEAIKMSRDYLRPLGV